MYYVYILQSIQKGTTYRGITNDLKKRLSEHNNGRVQSTKAYKPWNLVYYEAFSSKTDARREEIFLKSGKGRQSLKERLLHTLRRGG